MKFRIVFGIVCALAATTAKADVDDCVEIEDPRQRLACYDAALKRDAAKPEKRASEKRSAEVVESKPAPRTPAARPETKKPVARTTPTTTKPAKVQQEKPKKEQRQRSFTAAIVKTTKLYDNRIVYTLDNGEKWTQTHAQVATIYEGDAVTVNRLRMGAHYMSTDRGARVRVKQTK